MPTVEINYLAVLVAAIANMLLGMFWYSPAGFGNAWLKTIGATQADIEKAKQKGMAGSFALGFAGALVLNYVLAHMVDFANATTVKGGLSAGFWIWLGFVAATYVSFVAWENRSWKWYAISAGYYLVVLLSGGIILAVWA